MYHDHQVLLKIRNPFHLAWVEFRDRHPELDLVSCETALARNRMAIEDLVASKALIPSMGSPLAVRRMVSQPARAVVLTNDDGVRLMPDGKIMEIILEWMESHKSLMTRVRW